MCRYTVHMPRVKCLVDDPDDKECKLLLLDKRVEASTLQGLPETVRDTIAQEEYVVTSHDMLIGYSHFSAEQILRV